MKLGRTNRDVMTDNDLLTSQCIMEHIRDVINDDLQDIEERKKYKIHEREILREQLEIILTEYEDFKSVNRGKITDALLKKVRSAFSRFNNFRFIELDEASKLAKYTSSLIAIERNNRDDVIFSGMADMSDQELLEYASDIVNKAKKSA